jgi:hypothetical protein
MAQPSDPFKGARELPNKSQETLTEKENDPQKNKPQKPPKSKIIPETTEQPTPQPGQLNWLDQPADPFRKAREMAANETEQEYLPSETAPDWRPQQVNEFHPEWMTQHTEPAFEITMEEEPNVTSQEVVQRPRSADRETATKTLEARSLVGTISFQLLLVDTWKALMSHPQPLLRKRMEGTINF